MNLISNKSIPSYPLSYSQKSVLFLQQLTPKNYQLNQYIALKISSYVEIEDLKQTFEKLVSFHPILGAKYLSNIENNNFTQVIEEVELNFKHFELLDLSEKDLHEKINNIINTPFDLEKEAPFRVRVLTRAENEHILIINTHYIAFDPQSWEILLKDFQTIYDQVTNNQEISLPRENNNQYFDFIAWQQEFLTTETAKNTAQYWQNKLKGEIPVLNLPFDKSLSSVAGNKQKVITVIYYQELFDEIKKYIEYLTQELFFEKRLNFEEKLESFLLTLLEVFLYRYTGQDQILIGSLANFKTNNDQFKQSIGNFLNQIVIKGNIPETSTFKELLFSLKQEVREIHKNQDYPFELLVEKIVKQRDLSRPPLVEILLDLPLKGIDPDIQNLLLPYAPIKQFNWHGLIVERFDEFRESNTIHNLDLHLEFFPTEDSLIINWHYNTELFNDSTIERMIPNFQVLLEGILKDIDQPINTLPILTQTETEEILINWNQTKVDYPNVCIHQLIEIQAQKHPQKIAVTYGNQSLTYQQLNQKADQLGIYLQNLGVKPDSKVGICLERSLDLIVGLLGILKSGGAYIPLDPTFPPDRLAFMVEDSQLGVLVTQKSLKEILPPITKDLNIVEIDQKWPEINQFSQNKTLNHTVKPHNLAYLIYTSGSTGKPKGVQINHSCAVNFLTSMEKQPGLKETDILLAVTTISFDIAVLELYLPLITGASVVIASSEIARNGVELAQLIDHSQATVLQATPASWQMLLEAGWQGKKDLKILCGGESLPQTLISQLLEKSACLWNMYGPTETTVWSTCANIITADYPITIGTPINNTQVYILDSNLQPVPIGVAGELYIGGDGLARGYLNREELTTEKFIFNPFSDDPQSRIYNTGDLAKWLPNGTIECLGRSDHQVKIRGFRIELGEIESLLTKRDDIASAVVVAREDNPGDKRLVAYYVTKDDQPLSVNELRDYLGENLPKYMIPAGFMQLESLPLTPNKKVDRKALPKPETHRPILNDVYSAPKGKIESIIGNIWADLLLLDQVGVEDNFFDLGGNSLLVLRVVSRIKEELDFDFPIIKLFQYPTINGIAKYINQNQDLSSNVDEDLITRFEKKQTTSSHDIAIIGMVGRFPGANNVEKLWENLCNNVDSNTFFTDEELDPSIDPALKNNPNYVKVKGIIENCDRFDASFFGINPLEAQMMDPQQRIFLEVAYEALENAGYTPENYKGLIGLYAGAGYNTYLLTNIAKNPEALARFGDFQTMLVNDKDYMPTKISYKLNLTGSSVNINTACSTSLVAVIYAVNSLRNYECDLALAGGISISTPINSGYLYQEGAIFSPDGVCRPFDVNSQGTMFNNGAGIVVLKRLEDALKDGDRIEAVIKGVGINNDGANKVSFTAPSVDGQAQAIMMAHRDGKINPETISYIEAHGTGTPLGDPIEIAGLTQAFSSQTDKKQFCAIGSIKSNVGHLVAAAGVAGLIKTALALKYEQIPASLHFTSPNPTLDLPNTPFFVNNQLTPWVRGDQPRRAGISSFGVGGTNAHVVVEEAPEILPSSESRPQQLLLISAKTPTALDTATHNLAQFLSKNPDLPLADVAYTLQLGRQNLPHRRFVVCGDTSEAIANLTKLPPNKTANRHYKGEKREIIFMFPGQGSQYVNMGLNLYQTEALFKEIVDQCSEILHPHLGDDLRHFLYPQVGDEEKAAISLQETRITQPAIFTIEYALAKLWMSWGITPDGAIGHSIGEFVAATLAGIFTLEDSLKLVAIRGKLMQDQPRGSMLSVKSESSQVQQWLNSELSEDKRGQCAIATINSPSLCVVSGPTEIIKEFQNNLEKKEVICKFLHTSHAFHSPMMEPILEPFGKIMADIPLNKPQFPILSTVTAQWLTDSQATDPQYWTNHLRATVRFADGIKVLWEQKERILLEIGPRTTTATLARQQITSPKEQIAISSLSSTADNNQEWVALLQAIAQLWLVGKIIKWDQFYQLEKRHRLGLPTYPFEGKPYWVDTVTSEQLPVTSEQLPVSSEQVTS
jgi:amino acid adenylation domain-containing protein